MKYEIWDVMSLTPGEPFHPFTKLFESDDFMETYDNFQAKNRMIPCILIANKEKIDPKYFTNEKIFESPDGGKTIYEREMLQEKRKQIK